MSKRQEAQGHVTFLWLPGTPVAEGLEGNTNLFQGAPMASGVSSSSSRRLNCWNSCGAKALGEACSKAFYNQKLSTTLRVFQPENTPASSRSTQQMKSMILSPDISTLDVAAGQQLKPVLGEYFRQVVDISPSTRPWFWAKIPQMPAEIRANSSGPDDVLRRKQDLITEPLGLKTLTDRWRSVMEVAAHLALHRFRQTLHVPVEISSISVLSCLAFSERLCFD